MVGLSTIDQHDSGVATVVASSAHMAHASGLHYSSPMGRKRSVCPFRPKVLTSIILLIWSIYMCREDWTSIDGRCDVQEMKVVKDKCSDGLVHTKIHTDEAILPA